MSSPSLNSSYLPHVNGLRALAILGVLVYHLRASYCPAGYFGVDLFLVISGFLLFRSLLKPGVEQQFHYGSYLLKKAWRIIPSWFVVTLVVCTVSMYLLAPSRVGDILKTARYSALFHADYYIDRSGDYFNVFSQQNPLLHYWYLSITQQIYIIAPLLVIPLARWCSRRAAIILLAILALLSFVYYIITTSPGLVPEALSNALLHGLGTKTAYYHLVPRFWEFAAGFGVFLLPEFANRPRLRATLGLAGLLGIVSSFYLYQTGSPAVYLAVAASLLALRYGGSGFVAWLLNSKPLQALGTISFSLYLWHWPVMVFWKYCCLDSPSPGNELLMVGLCLILGTLSWYAIERLKTPSLSGWKGTLLRSSLLLLLPLVLIGSTKAYKYNKKQVVLSNAAVSTAPAQHPETDEALLRGLDFLPAHNMKMPPKRLGAAEATPSFLFMGDSHAEHLSAALDAACEKAGIRGLYLNNSTLPFWNLTVLQKFGDPACWNEQLANSLLEYLRQHPELRYVVIALRWEKRLRDAEGQDWRTGEVIRTEEARMAVTGAGLGEWCDRIRALGKGVILLGDNPTFDLPFPLDEWERYHELRLLQLIRPYRERIISPAEHEAKQEFSYKVHRQLVKEGRAHCIDLAPALQINGHYPARDNGVFLYRDDNHLTPAGSKRAVDYLMPRLLEILGNDKL